jgi:hypothetical protein
LRHSVAIEVERPKLRATGEVATIARLLKERERTCCITRDAGALYVEDAESRAPSHRSEFAPPPVQSDREAGVTANSFPFVIEASQRRTTRADPSIAGLLEHVGGTGVVAKYVLTLEELEPELIAGVRITCRTRTRQALRFLVTGMATG